MVSGGQADDTPRQNLRYLANPSPTIRSIDMRLGFFSLACAFGMSTIGAASAQAITEKQILEALSLRATQADENAGFRNSRTFYYGERAITIEGPEQEVPSIDIRVNFDFDSIDLSNETRLSLNALGNALTNEVLVGDKIEIVGHTDGKGTDVYNQELSENRAAAVVSYLVKEFNIEPSRISHSGMGEGDLLITDDPESDLNRRVEVRNITQLK